jgi:hypothetical protein
MVFMIMMLLVVFTCSRCNAKTCNQVIYDKIYKEIVLDAMKYDIKSKQAEYTAMQTKHRLIYTLRKLCNGQKSTWETKK